MGLFQRLGRLIGIGKTNKRFPAKKMPQPTPPEVFKPMFAVKNNNRVSHINWGSCSLMLAKQYR